MAQIEISAGGLTSAVTTTDANASKIIKNALRKNGVNPDAMSNQEVLDAGIALIKRYFQSEASAYAKTAAAQEAYESTPEETWNGS